MSSTNGETGVTRRQMMKRTAAGAAIAWTAPTVLSMQAANASTSPMGGTPGEIGPISPVPTIVLSALRQGPNSTDVVVTGTGAPETSITAFVDRAPSTGCGGDFTGTGTSTVAGTFEITVTGVPLPGIPPTQFVASARESAGPGACSNIVPVIG